jgi:hypothetical protein
VPRAEEERAVSAREMLEMRGPAAGAGRTGARARARTRAGTRGCAVTPFPSATAPVPREDGLESVVPEEAWQAALEILFLFFFCSGCRGA